MKSRRHKATRSWIGALTLLVGCDPADTDSAGTAGAPGGKADEVRICPDGPPAYADPGDDASAPVRLQALRSYAAELMLAKTCELDDLLVGEGLIGTEPLEHAYRLTVGADGCLDEALRDDDNHDELVTQVEAVVQFLTAFHEDMDGVKTDLFSEVHVCTEDTYDAHLQLKDDVLGVGVSFSTLGIGMAPKDGLKVRKWWRKGKQIEHRDDVVAWNDEFWFDGTDDLWTVLDPVGDARLSLRNSMGERAMKLAEALGELDEEDEVDTSKLADLVREHVSNLTPHRNVKACALGYLEGKSDAQLAAIAARWRDGVSLPAVWDAMAQSAIAQSQPPTKIADRSVAQECGTMDFSEVELPHIDVRSFLADYVDTFSVYLGIYGGEKSYAEGSASCWFQIEEEDVVVSADGAVPTAAMDHVLFDDEVDCEAVAIPDEEPDSPPPEPEDPTDDDVPDLPDEPPSDDTDGGTDGRSEPGGDTDGGTGSTGGPDGGGATDGGDYPDGDGDSDGDGATDGGTGDPPDHGPDSDDPYDPDDPDDPFDPSGGDGSPWGDGDPAPMDDSEVKQDEAGCSVGDRPESGASLLLGLFLLGLAHRRDR